MRDLFCKLRKKYGKTEKWLMDLWQIVRGFGEDRSLLWEKKYYRIACHAPRASYCTAAYEVCNKDLMATKILSGHSNTKDLERYVKISGIMEKKEELKNRFMDPLISAQRIPLSKSQTKLKEFS